MWSGHYSELVNKKQKYMCHICKYTRYGYEYTQYPGIWSWSIKGNQQQPGLVSLESSQKRWFLGVEYLFEIGDEKNHSYNVFSSRA